MAFVQGFEKIALKIDTYVRALEGRQNRVREQLAKIPERHIKANKKLRMASAAVSPLTDTPHKQVKKLVDAGISPETKTHTKGWKIQETTQRTHGMGYGKPNRKRVFTTPGSFNARTRIHNEEKKVIPPQWKKIFERGKK